MVRMIGTWDESKEGFTVFFVAPIAEWEVDVAAGPRPVDHAGDWPVWLYKSHM